MPATEGLVCFIGPLPPPVHGFSEISRRMLSEIRKQHQVAVFDVAPRKAVSFDILMTWSKFVICLLRRKPKALYLGLSGGHRQWIDLAFVLPARLCGLPIIVHHHSFSYLNEQRLSATVLFRSLRKAIHIVLCGCMGDQLAKAYSIQLANVRVLSNAAFLDDIGEPAHARAGTGLLRVGFLSNITAEKGIFEFLSVLRGSIGLGLELQGLIAGPVDPSIRNLFDATLAAAVNVQYVGPVYGKAKTAFFADIDVLLFPTRYPNEAEPVTIVEAFAHGVPVVAFSRGCIDEMIPAGAGRAFHYSGGFVKEAIDALRPFAEDGAQLSEARQAAREGFHAMRASGKTALRSLVAEMGTS